MKKDTGGAAFPELGNIGHNSDWQSESGMTLRDYFAGQALSGMLSNGFMPAQYGADVQHGDKPWDWAKAAYAAADAMLEARK